MNGALRVGLSLLLQSTLLLSLGIGVAWLLRRHGPALRAFILQMTLLGVSFGSILSVSLIGHVQPVWTIPTTPTLPSPVPMEDGDGAMRAPLVPAKQEDAPPATQAGAAAGAWHTMPRHAPEGVLAAGSPPPRPSPLPLILTSVWAGGAALLLFWLAFCQCRLLTLKRRAHAITRGRAFDGLARLSAAQNVAAPSLIASVGVRSPFLAGILRPAIFLSAAWGADYDDTMLHIILAHELAHHTRRDCAWTLLLRLTTAALWPQPLLWLLARQLDQNTEEACDLLAVSPDCPLHRYADTLLTLAESVLPSRAERTLGASVVPIRSAVGQRIQNILAWRDKSMKAPSRRARALAALAVTIAVAAGVVLCSAVAVPPNPAVRTVRQLLSDRAYGQYAAASIASPGIPSAGIPVSGYVYDRRSRKPLVCVIVDFAGFSLRMTARMAGFPPRLPSITGPTGEFHSVLFPGRNALIVDNAKSSDIKERIIRYGTVGTARGVTSITTVGPGGKTIGPIPPSTYQLVVRVPRGYAVQITEGAGCFTLIPFPQSADPAPDAAVSVVQQYLSDLSSGDHDAAYQLLTAATRETQSQTDFERGSDYTHYRGWKGRLSLAASLPAFTAATALFWDTHNTLGATYTVVGLVPGKPDLVRVTAQVPGVSAPIPLNVQVIADATSDAGLRIDEAETYQHTDIEAYRRLLAKRELMSSLNQLHTIALAIFHYTQGHNEVMPDAAHWVDEIILYLVPKAVIGTERQRVITSIFHDPLAPTVQTWGYAFNRALSHLPLSRVNAPASVVMLFPNTRGTKNASDTGQSLPRYGWVMASNAYAYADGHPKWINICDPRQPSFDPSFEPSTP